MLLENIKEAFHSLSNNRMRSLLTMLGIIIGIAAVITITTIGSSIRSTLSATMNALAGNMLEVYMTPVIPDDVNWDTFEYPEMEDEDYITQEMLDELQETYPDEVKGYSMSQPLGSGQIYENSSTYANVSVTGTTPAMLDSMNLDFVKGRCINDEDNRQAKSVCVIADTMAENYFKGRNPLGEILQYEDATGSSYQFTVVGVYEYKESVFGKPDTTIPEKDRMTQIYIPINALMSYSDVESKGYEWIDIILQTGCDPTQAEQDIMDYFSEQYAGNERWEPGCYNMSSELGTIDTVINVITIAISFIAAISLIVGGVGVMNIMLVSITERTREIGIRKALGATNRNIRQQFLIESIVLCVIGGIIGIILGIVFGIVIGKVAVWYINMAHEDMADMLVMSVHPSVLAIILSLGFSMIIGVFFGSYPAKKAAEMEVIDALGYE